MINGLNKFITLTLNCKFNNFRDNVRNISIHMTLEHILFELVPRGILMSLLVEVDPTSSNVLSLCSSVTQYCNISLIFVPVEPVLQLLVVAGHSEVSKFVVQERKFFLLLVRHFFSFKLDWHF